MTLPAGSRIGAYEIVSLIGRGGMGEVYRARDTRLGRDVAVKTLAGDVAADRDFLSRFEREARVLASLSHPNIAVIHGVEEGGPNRGSGEGVSALVMELIEGETLDERIRRGPIPLDEALEIARQIADALDAAHEQGIAHRDLKPANVKITPRGVVKVLDFGLAKTVTPRADDGVTASMTGAAVLVGTPAYMSPEQVQGKPASTGVDVWAFGVLLYEMLTGERPFTGPTVPDTLAAVLTGEPDVQRVPAAVRPLLRACLDRDPRKRLRSIGDYRFLIGPTDDVPRPERRTSPARLLLLTAIGIAAMALAYAAGTRSARPDAPPRTTPIRLSTMLPAGASVTRGPSYASSVAVSPDGQTLVIAGRDESGQRLYRRTLDRLEPTPLDGSERGSSPFFSWDGAWIGFFADGRLKRIPATGGAAVDIAEAPGFPAGASWGPDDRIAFAYGADNPLHVVPARGGTVQRVANVAIGRNPDVLADGRTVLYESRGRIHVLDLPSGDTKELVAGSAPRYAAGHVILSRGTTLLAAPLDLETHELSGPAFPIAEGVAIEPGGQGGGHYASSRSGSLAFVPSATSYSLVLIRENGIEQEITEPTVSFENPRFSPDGRSLVVAAKHRPDEPADLWLHDVVSRTSSRLTFDGGRAPVWGPDGATVTYSHLGGDQGIYTKRVDGRGEPRRLAAMPSFHWLVGWAAGSKTLVYGAMDGTTSSIVALGNTKPRTVVAPGHVWGGRLSGDGRWLAYYVLERGIFNIYVQPFPEGETRWLIAEGTDPSWSPDGREIFYRSGSRLMAARIDEGFRVLSRRVVVEPFLPPLYDDYDIHPDGRTLVVVRPSNRTQGREITMVLDAFADAARKQ